MTVYKTQIFESNTKVYIDHFAGIATVRAEYRQSFAPDTTITTIRLYLVIDKIEVWDIFGRYYVDDTDKPLSTREIGFIIRVNGIEVKRGENWIAENQWELDEQITADLTQDNIKLDGSLNTIEIEFYKGAVGNSNSYQIWFESWIEVAADQSPTETMVNVIPTTTREDVEPTTTSYEMAGQLIQFMMMFMIMTMMLSLISGIMEGLMLG